MRDSQASSSRAIDAQLQADRRWRDRQLKLLCVGLSGSGKSTWMKQMRLLLADGFSDSEMAEFGAICRQNCTPPIDAYFAANATRIMSSDFTLTSRDVLHCRALTMSAAPCAVECDGSRWLMVELPCGAGERRKIVPAFDDVTALISFVDVSSDDVCDALQLFEDLVNSRYFQSTTFVLFLNKVDLLRERLLAGYDLAVHFSEYAGGSNCDAALVRFRCLLSVFFVKMDFEHRGRGS